MLSSPRQGLTDLVNPLHSPRQGVTGLGSFCSPRQGVTGLTGIIHSPRQGVTSIWSSDFAAITTNPGSADWVSNGRNLVPIPEPSVTYAGHDLSSLLGDLEIKIPLNGKSTANFLLRPPSTNGIVTLPSPLAPPGTGTYANIIRQHDGTASRSFVFSVQFAGQTWRSETMVPGTPAYSGGYLKWSCEDVLGLLETTPETPLDDVIRAAGDLKMAHAAMAEHAAAIGIPVECLFKDYLLGEYRRGTGSRLQQMDALAKPMQAARRVENGRIVYQTVDTTAPPMWRFVDRLNIQSFEVTEYPRAQNSFVLTRFTPAGGKIGDASGNTVGRQSVTFTPSLWVTCDVIKAVQGRLDDWVFFSESGAALTTPEAIGIYSGQIPASRAEFSYIPQIGAAAYVPAWEVEVRGAQQPRETSYRLTADNTAHQAIYGVVPAPVIKDAIVGDQAGGQASVDAYCAESTRKVWRATLTTPYLNPFVRPGHIVEVADYLTQQDSTRWIVEIVTLSWKGQSWSMTLELSRGL